MYGIKNYIPHDEDEIIPVVVLPLADWQRLVGKVRMVQEVAAMKAADEVIDAIIASVEVQP